MSTPTLENLHETIERICNLIQTIQPAVERLKERPAQGLAWHDTLEKKLLPQTAADSPLIIAVAGGTNIGKSTIFNHLAQDDASGVSPMASGTKYPVCLVPPAWANQKALERLFQGDSDDGFKVIPWTDSQQPLLEFDRDVLFWREGRNLPEQLILLDTPDIDSNNQGNWRRAEKVRQMADLIIAVLTQQKYNDLACSQFFAEAANSGKQFLVVFNQVDLEEHAPYWPQWLHTFIRQVGQDPLLTYVCPHDRVLSRELRLPFYVLDPNQNYQIIPLPSLASDVNSEYNSKYSSDNSSDINSVNIGLRNFQNELASLHFNLLKYNSLKQALASALSPDSGLERWLADLEAKSDRFAVRLERFSGKNLGGFQPIPLPNKLVVQEFRRWRNSNLPQWERKILETYDFAATKITDFAKMSVQLIKRRPEVVPDTLTPEKQFMQEEQNQILCMVEKIFEQLDLESKNDDLTGEQLRQILGGSNREAVLNQISEEHGRMVPVDEGFREFIGSQLDAMLTKSPGIRILRTFDALLGAARPGITIALSYAAFLLGGPLAIPPVILIDIVLGKPASDLSTKELVQLFFSNVQEQYCKNRLAWVARLIRDNLLGNYLNELQLCATFKTSPELLELRELCQSIER